MFIELKKMLTELDFDWYAADYKFMCHVVEVKVSANIWNRIQHIREKFDTVNSVRALSCSQVIDKEG